VQSTNAADLLAQIRVHGAVPRHVAIIMDGNGRWARERLMPRPYGHRSGMRSVREVVEGAVEAGLEVLSLFAFSQENWQRPPTEITALMSLLEEYVAKEADELHARGVRVQALGALSRLTPQTSAAVERVVRQTAGNDRLTLNLFISYSARAELVRAARQLADDVAAGRLESSAIDEAEFASRLYTANIPDPDLLIRTSGELRVSNFLLWQISYAEIVIFKKYWPDFQQADLLEAAQEYARRHRRFGAL
jgi:undecaprenyl diphosphate synthase